MPSREMGERLKQLRERAGLSQEQLANRADVPIGTLRGWEYGRREPLLSAAGRLAVALEVEIGELLKPVERPAEQPSDEKPKRGRPRKASQPETEQPEEERDTVLRKTLADLESRYLALPPSAPEETGEELPAVKKSGRRGGKRKDG